MIAGLHVQCRFLEVAANPTRLSAGTSGCGTPNSRPYMRITAALRLRSDPGLAIAADIDGSIARQVKHGGGMADTSAGRAASRAYLIEELAAITLQGRAQGRRGFIPARSLPASAPFADGRVAGAPAGLERDYDVHVNLERRKAPAPLPHAARSITALKIA